MSDFPSLALGSLPIKWSLTGRGDWAVGGRHTLSVTVTLSLQDVGLYCPEPGASEESLASREAEPVSLGPARAEDRGNWPPNPLQER